MAENSYFDEEDHEEQLQRDHLRFHQSYQEEGKPSSYQRIIATPSTSKTATYSKTSLQPFCQQQYYRKHEQQQNEDSGIGSPSERNGGASYSNNVHSSSKYSLEPATSKISPRSSTSSNSSFSNNNNNNANNGRSASFQFHQLTTPTTTLMRPQKRGAAQEKPNYKSRTSRGERMRIASSSNCNNGREGSGGCNRRVTFLGRFRSQTNIADLHFPVKTSTADGSKSVMTSPVDHPPPSPVSLQGSSSNISGGSNHASHYGSKHHKPKKWFSFTNLLSRQNLTGILNIPKSRLSVSSTFNSVFVGPGSPPGESGPGSSFFNGYNNLSGEADSSNSPARTYGAPPSPTPSCATVSGEYPTRSLSAGANSNSGQVVFRRKNNGSNGVGAAVVVAVLGQVAQPRILT